MENRYSVYQKIRHDRTYRTLGKMRPWRVVLGAALLVLVFLISGVISQFFASHGSFRAAKALMIAPQWMEKYKPEVKAYIEAGVIFQNGEYEAACEAFSNIEDNEAAAAMKSVSAVELAKQRLAQGEYNAAYAAIEEADANYLPEDSAEAYRSVCCELLEYYSAENGSEAENRAQALRAVLDSLQA